MEEYVYYIKLTNGNDIVAVLLEEDGAHVKVKDAKQVRWMPDPRQGTVGMNLSHWVPHALVNTTHIHKDFVLLMERVDEDLESYYNHVVEMEVALQTGDHKRAHEMMHEQMQEMQDAEESNEMMNAAFGNNVSRLIH